LFVFCLLGLPFTKWWFNGDDFSGVALGKTMQTWKLFWSHFIEGNVNKYFYPSHHPLYTPYGATTAYISNCFGVYFRPIHCAYLAGAYWLFGFNAYAYFLVNVFLHALNATIIFNVLKWFSGWAIALFFALIFAFHPQIGFRFGAPANFQYYLDLLLILSSFLLLKQFLDNKKLAWYILSCISFLLSLFTRETSIFLPVIIFFGIYMYEQRDTQYSFKSFFKTFVHNLGLTLGYFICVGLYLGARIYLYPFKSTGQGLNLLASLLAWATKLPTRLEEFLFFFYDYLNLSWLPWGNKGLKLIIIAPLLMLFLWLFIKSTKKILILFSFFAFAVMLWPCFYINYSPRYLYESYPFALITFVLLFAFSGDFNKIIKRFGLVFLSLLCFLNIIMTLQNLKTRETKLFTIKQAFLALKNDTRITSGTRPLCFLAFPLDGFGTGIEQAAWLYLTPPANPVYYDPATMLTQNDSNILEHAGWYMRCAPYYTQNYFAITHASESIRFKSLNPQEINFSIPEGDYLSLGKKIIHQRACIKGRSVVTDFTLTFDQKYLKKNPLIITWDYEKKQFIVLD